MIRALFGLLVSLASVLVALPARADLASEADLVAAAWGARTGQAARLPPVFLEYGRLKSLSLPKSASDPTTPSCTSLALLTERSTDFVVRVDPASLPKHRATAGEAQRSAAGVVSFHRCGPEKASLGRLFVELRVARAALEVIVAEGPSKAPPIASVLPERAQGTLAPLPDPGPPPPLEPLDIRAQRAEARAQRAFAANMGRTSLVADGEGKGHEVLELEEGCHRIELLPEQTEGLHVDLDAEARDFATERLLARDRSDSPDARLELCVGARSRLKLGFAGAQASSQVLLLDAVFPLPEGLPAEWGARARAGMAAALRRRRVVELARAPESTWLGVSGATSIPIEVEPGACYLAAIAATRGDARYLMLAAHIDGRTAYDSNGGMLDGTAVSFCIEKQARTALEIDARGLSLAWVVSLWKIGSVSLGAER